MAGYEKVGHAPMRRRDILLRKDRMLLTPMRRPAMPTLTSDSPCAHSAEAAALVPCYALFIFD